MHIEKAPFTQSSASFVGTSFIKEAIELASDARLRIELRRGDHMNDEFLPRNKKLKSCSRGLRNNATRQENHLWYDFLKNHPVQFNRQRIIGEYIVDFHSPRVNLVIEIDGSQHYLEDAMAYDKRRTEYLQSLGLIVIRFTNKDIDSNFVGVCQFIEYTILSQMR